MNKLTTTIISASILSLSTTAMAEVQFADPDASGIGYEWTVRLSSPEKAEIIGSTGGKGSYEPSFEAPNMGWTHTTDWVALELKDDAILEIKLARQEGVYEMQVDNNTGEKSFTTSGAMLYPAMSIYEGWDSTTETEKGSFNSTGNFWSTIQFKAVVASLTGETSIIYRAQLPAGKYSVNIGGVNAFYCAETDACYKGVHGYHAIFTASPVPKMLPNF